LFRTLSIG
jgi:hypothetical protein